MMEERTTEGAREQRGSGGGGGGWGVGPWETLHSGKS